MEPMPSKCLALKNHPISCWDSFWHWLKSVSNSSFSYFFRPWLHRQSFDIWNSINRTLPLNSAAMVQPFAASPWTKLGKWSQLKINQHFVLFFLRITFQPGQIPNLLCSCTNSCISTRCLNCWWLSSCLKPTFALPAHLIAWLLQNRISDQTTQRGLDCHCLQPWRVSPVRQNEVTLMSTLQLRHGYWAPSSCCLSKIICHFCSLHAEINIKTWLTKSLMRMNSFGASSETKLSQKLHNH